MNISARANLHSNAYNFPDFVSAGVDPRTGTYSSSVSLSSLLANTLSGPSIPLALGFNALQGENIGFGIGWSLPLSSYNRKTRKLNLSTGASYVATVSSDAFVIIDKKIRDIKASRAGTDLIIEHKSGIVEVLSNPGLSWDEWMVSKIYSAEGRAITLTYGIVAGRRYLREISDENQRLLQVDAAGASSSAPGITLWPDSPENALRFRFQIRNNELDRITLQLDNNASASWRFTYVSVGGLRLISQLELPTGGLEQVSYQSSALRLPSGAPVSALPAVASHTVIPRSDQPAITREYRYSVNNYLGYGSNAPWRNDSDNLYRTIGDYEYDSTEDLVLGQGNDRRTVRRTQRTYNRFHLLVKDVTSQNGKVVSTRTQYHELTGVTFDRQPANFQLPKRVETAYYDSATPGNARKDVTLTEFDDAGNLLKKVSPSGITEVFEYYPVGVSDGCPDDAFGTVRWLKQKTVLPAADRALAPSLITHFRYTQLPSASAERGQFLVLEQESVCEGEQDVPFMAITREYQSDTGSPFFGRVVRKIETVQGIDTRFDYRYELAGGVLKTDTTLSTEGGISSRKSSWQHALTGREMKTLDHLGVAIETTHDRLGRKIVESVAAQTANQALKTYGYHLTDKPGDAMETLWVGAGGAETRTRFDGMSRELSVDIQDVDHLDQPMRTVYTARYDGLGQLIEENDIDWLDGEPYALTTAHLYDDWGNRCTSIGPDGVPSHDRQDPIARVRSQWREGSGKTVSIKNVFGKDDSVERFDRFGKSCGVTQYLYDGLGRCVQKTDPQGHVTEFTYDVADRLLITRLPDGTQVKKQYVKHSTEDLPTKILVNDYLVGERTYDGLLRISSVTVGGRTETYTYEGTQPSPATHTTASGKVITYTYDPALNNQMTERVVEGDSNLSARFRYDSVHARLIQASSPGNQQQRDYFPSGKLRAERLIEGKEQFQSSHQYSLNGLPLRYTDAGGEQQVLRYDPLCRISEVEQGSVKAKYTYDTLGRVGKIETLDTLSQRLFTTQIEYDDFGRESRRLLAVDTSEPEELLQQFNESDKLIRRTLKRGDVVLRDETYSYDARGRLELYQCAGEHLPVDPCGKAVLTQAWVFDALDNVLQMKTGFVGGENVATYLYEYPDKTQLSRVSHSHPDYAAQAAVFTYDRDGNQLNDERGRQLIYDDLSRLASVKEVQP